MQSFFRRSIRLISSTTANFKSVSNVGRLFRQPVARAFLSSSNAFESMDDFEQRIFGNSTEKDSSSDPFFKKLDRVRERSRSGTSGGSAFGLDGLDEDFTGLDGNFDDTLNDGMDGKLKRAATDFDYNSEEVEQEDYKFRPDMTFMRGMTYELKDLDLTKPGIPKPFKKEEFQTTTEEVMRKADFRNVRFLSNFITEAGILNKRSKTGIRAKAQRKVAREIKTARAFGLMPFTTMGTKAFAFGRKMEDLDDDYEPRSIRRRPMDADFTENNPFGDFKGFGPE